MSTNYNVTDDAAVRLFARLALTERFPLHDDLLWDAISTDASLKPTRNMLLTARALGWRVWFTLAGLDPETDRPRQLIIVQTGDRTYRIGSCGRMGLHEQTAYALDYVLLRS